MVGLMITATSPYLLVLPLFLGFGIGLGLAVPATDIAVMAAAPDRLAGAASATMNALRQSGMTIGIALLGIILEMRAVSTLTQSLSAANVVAAPVVAGTAVRLHEIPDNIAMPEGRFSELLAEAYQHGFMAMFILSGCCSLAVALILSMRRSEARGPSSEAGSAPAPAAR